MGQPDPPLPTFLGPRNENRNSLLVASILDFPNPMRNQPLRHQYSFELKEDCVGYHLINMCNSLSEYMSILIPRINMSLSVRWRERGDILDDLQDYVYNIWVVIFHVEMYGSCVIQIYLHSSGLYVVISVLDNNKPTQHQRGSDNTHVGKVHKVKKKQRRHPSLAHNIENDGED